MPTFIIITGNVVDGMSFHGPFANAVDAVEWAQSWEGEASYNGEYTVTELRYPVYNDTIDLSGWDDDDDDLTLDEAIDQADALGWLDEPHPDLSPFQIVGEAVYDVPNDVLHGLSMVDHRYPLECDTCGTRGTEDDGIEEGGLCAWSHCNGTIRSSVQEDEASIRSLAAFHAILSAVPADCIVVPGQDSPSLWECDCPECTRLQRQAEDEL